MATMNDKIAQIRNYLHNNKLGEVKVYAEQWEQTITVAMGIYDGPLEHHQAISDLTAMGTPDIKVNVCAGYFNQSAVRVN